MSQEILLSFDIGERKTGIAIGNSFLKQARPLKIIFSRRKEIQLEKMRKLLEEWKPERVIMGITFTNSLKNQSNRRVLYFANLFRHVYKIKVELVDESYSSREAQEILKNNKPDDAIAAYVILQRYLDNCLN